MPIESFTCDVTNQPVHFRDCISCAESGKAMRTFQCQHSPDVLRGIQKTIRAGMDTLSATELLECPRALWFKKKQGFSVKPSKAFWAFRGTLFHSLFELSKQLGDIVEERYYAEVGGNKISGQPDLIRGQNIHDYKTTKQVPDKPNPHHVLQLEIYQLILSKQTPKIDITKGFITYLSMQEHKVIPVALRPLHETEKFVAAELASRYAMLAKDEPPPFKEHFDPKNWKCGRAPEYSYCDVRGACTQGQEIPEPVRKSKKVTETK